MAEVKISQLTAKGSNLASTDLVMISEVSGGGYVSKYVTGAEISSGGGASTEIDIETKTISYTAVLADANKLIELNSATGVAFGVPTNSTDAFPIGTQILVSQLGAGQVTITPISGVTLRSNGGKLKISGQYGLCTLIKRATDEWYVSGDLTT